MNSFFQKIIFLLLPLGLCACSNDQEEQLSQLNDLVVRVSGNGSVVFYSDDDFVFRRYCDINELNPSRVCPQTSTDPRFVIKPLKAIPKNLFLRLAGGEEGSILNSVLNSDKKEVPYKYEGEHGDEALKKEIEVAEAFISDPEITQEERAEGQSILANLRAHQEAKKMAHFILEDLLKNEVIETSTASSKFKRIHTLFDAQDTHVMVYDEVGKEWWRFLGGRNLNQAQGRKHITDHTPMCELYGGHVATVANWLDLQKNKEAFQSLKEIAAPRDAELWTYPSDKIGHALVIDRYTHNFQDQRNWDFMRFAVYCIVDGPQNP